MSFRGRAVSRYMVTDVRGHVVQLAERAQRAESGGVAQPHAVASVVAAAGAARVPIAAISQRRLHDLRPRPPRDRRRASPLPGVPRRVPLGLAAGATRGAAARGPRALRGQALRLRAVRPELQV